MTDTSTDKAVERTETVKERMARFAALFNEDRPEPTPEEAQLAIVAQILAQSTAETILASRDTRSSAEYVGVPFTLLDVDVRDSDFADAGPSRYMILRCVDDDGQPFAMTSGSMNIMAAAWNLADRGLTPVRCQVKRADRPSASGYYPLWLEDVPTL